MAVRGNKKAVDKNEGKTQMELAKDEAARRQRGQELRQQDVAEVSAGAAKGWVEIVTDPLASTRRGPRFATEYDARAFHRYRCGYLLRELKTTGQWYVFENVPNDDEPLRVMRVISVSAWAKLFLNSNKPLLILQQPKETGDERRDQINFRLWQQQCKAIISAAAVSGVKWHWNGGKDAEPWFKCGVLRVARMKQAA